MKRNGAVAALLLYLVASLGFASQLWWWVLDFDPGFVFKDAGPPSGPPLTSSVTVILVDGLRLDSSRHMASLNELRRRGADVEGRVGTPSFSRPGRATIGVGAPPDIHGVTTNRQKRSLKMDNLFRRVSASGGACRVAGSKIWSSLFGEDIARCGEFRAGETKEGPGAFVRQAPDVRAAQESGLEFIFQQPAVLRVADILSTDFAAHEYGGVSREYAAELDLTDQYIADVISRLDLSVETLVVTADHGHRDAGGHGGQEPVVLAIPIVMAGAGIRPLSTAVANQADIAPTIAALLGLDLPAGASGRPIDSIFAADDSKLGAVSSAAALQRASFEQAVRMRMRTPDGGHPSDWAFVDHLYRVAARSRRFPVAVLLAMGALVAALFATNWARPGATGLAFGILFATLATLGPVRWFMPPLSFSAINYDEMLVPFFSRIMILAAVVTVASIAFALVAEAWLDRGERRDPKSGLAGSISLLGATALVMGAIAAWVNHGLLLPLALPGPDRLVESFALALSTTSVSLTGLGMVAILRPLENRVRGRRDQSP